MAMITRCSDPHDSYAGALWPHEPHKLNVFIVTAKLNVIPQTTYGGTVGINIKFL